MFRQSPIFEAHNRNCHPENNLDLTIMTTIKQSIVPFLGHRASLRHLAELDHLWIAPRIVRDF